MPGGLKTRHRVKELAEQQLLSIMTLARRAKLSYGATRMIYHNPYHQAKYSTWYKLASVFDIPVAELVHVEGEQQQDTGQQGQEMDTTI